MIVLYHFWHYQCVVVLYECVYRSICSSASASYYVPTSPTVLESTPT